MAVIAKDLFSIVHYEYGEAYYGSYEMMCYRVAREPLENVHFTPPEKRGPAILRCTVWPGPYAYAKTPEEQKIVKDFEYSQQGLNEIAAYLNQTHDAWKKRDLDS